MVAGATDTRDGSRVAIKRCGKVLAINQHDSEATIAKRMLREVLLLRALDHPNVISILELWHNDKDMYLVCRHSQLTAVHTTSIGRAIDGGRSSQSHPI